MSYGEVHAGGILKYIQKKKLQGKVLKEIRCIQQEHSGFLRKKGIFEMCLCERNIRIRQGMREDKLFESGERASLRVAFLLSFYNHIENKFWSEFS